MVVGAARELPHQVGVLPLRDTVTFPDMLIPLNVGQQRSVELINDVLRGDRTIAMVASRNTEEATPTPEDLYDVGVLGVVARMIRVPDGTLRVLIQGGQRIRVEGWVSTEPYLVAEITEAPDVVDQTPELTALMRNVQHTFTDIIEQVPYLPEELQIMVANVDDPSVLAHLIAGALRIPTEEKQALLEELDVAKRLRKLSEILARELEVVAIGSKIQSQVQSELDKGQREYFLRQQLKAIQEELGEADEVQAEVNELRAQLEELDLPEVVRKQVDRELARLERLQPAMAEYGVVRAYLEWIAALPWDKETEDNLDLEHARAVLDEDHYDIEQVKDRILEFLAVRQLKPDARGSILCFVGPPGVGKTSLGRSMARALGRKFERISVGGLRDEAEIRGHRRTYIGAMPGVIIRALRDAAFRNPLLMIDEIDKMGSDFRGDPSSAMLEVLDPEQNHAFRDYYLDLPFDLSDVMFVCTANTLDTIPGPLRDRMEVIQLAGYTEAEKLEIARRYLVPRQIDRNGLSKSRIAFTDPALRVIIADYTREAGVRQLEREIGTICRKVARQVAEGTRQAQGHDHRAARPRDARQAKVLLRDPQTDLAPRRRHRAGVDAGRWRGAVHRGDRVHGERSPDDHRPARRRDAGVGAGRALVCAQQRVGPRPGPARGLVRHPRHPRPRPGRRDAQGRPERRGRDGHGAGLAPHRTARPRRRGDDRRDHPDRASAPDRRAQGEGPGRAARWDPHRDRAEAERAGRRRDPRALAQGSRVSVRRDDRGGARDLAPAAGRAPPTESLARRITEALVGARLQASHLRGETTGGGPYSRILTTTTPRTRESNAITK